MFESKSESSFQLQLTLLCSLALEEKLLDSLLILPQVSVFTSSESAAHGVNLSNMNAMEQVMGRAQIVQIQVLLSERDKSFVIDQLKSEFAHTQIRYWITPILEEGVLS